MGNVRLTAVLTFSRSQSCSVGDMGWTRPGTVVLKWVWWYPGKDPEAEGNMAIYLELGLFLAKSREFIYSEPKEGTATVTRVTLLCVTIFLYADSGGLSLTWKAYSFTLTIPLCPYSSHQNQMGSVAIRQQGNLRMVSNCLIERVCISTESYQTPPVLPLLTLASRLSSTASGSKNWVHNPVI